MKQPQGELNDQPPSSIDVNLISEKLNNAKTDPEKQRHIDVNIDNYLLVKKRKNDLEIDETSSRLYTIRKKLRE